MCYYVADKDRIDIERFNLFKWYGSRCDLYIAET